MQFVVQQEKFEGPLDVLLDLIEREKLSITEISLAQVADSYIVYVKSLEKIDPEQLAEFLVVAAHLMLIKSRALLPSLRLSQEDEGSIEELEKRLAEYQKMRELAKELRRMEGERRVILTHEAFWKIDPVFYPPRQFILSALGDAFAAFMAALPKIERIAEEKIKKIISLEEKISHIRSFLSNSLEGVFSQLVKGVKEKVEVIVSFLAILELAKQKFLELDQEKMFEDIKIRKI